MRCPTPAQLDFFLNGAPTTEDAAKIAAHVDKCKACQTVLESLSKDSRHVGSQLRQPVTQSLSPSLTRMVQLPGDSSVSIHETLTGGTEGEATSILLPTVEGYEILGLLGRGGQAVVYKARDKRLKRLVALKMLRTMDAGDSRTLERFRREAEALARLHHPNIVQIFEVGEQDGTPFFA